MVKKSKDDDVLVKRKLAQIQNIIREKVKALRMGEDIKEQKISEKYKPITKPLNELISNIKEDKNKANIAASSSPYSPINTNIIVKPETKKKLSFSTPTYAPSSYSTPKRKYVEDDDDDYEDDDDSNAAAFDKSSLEEEDEEEDSFTNKKSLNNTLFKEYLKDSESNEKEYDKKTSIINDSTGKWRIGNKYVHINRRSITIDGDTYRNSNGLFELIFKKNPKLDSYSKTDLKNYKKIIEKTNLYNVDFNERNKIDTDSNKYKEIVFKHKLLADALDTVIKRPRKKISSRKKKIISSRRRKNISGSGLQKREKKSSKMMMKVNNLLYQYVYWDNLNELVDRLRLLNASKAAGNTSLDNEINSIIEELREAGCIY